LLVILAKYGISVQITVQISQGKDVKPIQKITNAKRVVESVILIVGHLPNKYKAMNTNINTKKKRRKAMLLRQ
jgi:hypothetical protein